MPPVRACRFPAGPHLRDPRDVRSCRRAARLPGNSPEAVLELIGTHGFAKLAGRYPELIDEHHDALSLLFTLEDVIHPQVKVLYPDAIAPRFDIEKVAANRLLMRYRSPR